MTRCAELEPQQHAFCILIGSTTLIVGVILKKLPESWNSKIPKLIDERASTSNDPLVKMYKAQAEAKVSSQKPGSKSIHSPVKPK